MGTKKEKSPYGASTLVWEKSPNGAFNCTKRTFLQNRNEPHLLKSTPSGPFSRPKIKHLWDFSLFLGPRLQSQFLGWKNAFTPHLIDSDGRTFHKDSEYGPNSKIMKNTKRTFLQTTADLVYYLAGKPTHENCAYFARPCQLRTLNTYSKCTSGPSNKISYFYKKHNFVVCFLLPFTTYC